MKNFLLFAFTLMCSTALMAQGSETFTNLDISSSYQDGSFVGDNGVTWSFVESRNSDGYQITGEGIMLRRSSDGSTVISSAVAGGIGDFTCSLKKAFTGSGNRQVELFVNGVSQGTSTPFDNTTTQTFSVTGINIIGNVTIEVRNITSKQVIVDDISWTAAPASGNPIVGFDALISSTTEGATGTTTTVDVPVTMDMAPSADVTVTVASTDGTATTADSDYTAVSTTLSFLTTDTYPLTQNVSVDVTGDDTVEPDEDLTLDLSVTTGTADVATATHTLTITTDDFAPLPNIRINEVDSNTPGTDAAEFLELFGDPNMALDNISLVFFNGSNDTEYRIVDLDGQTTDANGYFIYGNIPGAEMAGAVATNLIQNGSDAIALYVGDFPDNGTVTTTDLIDALVYGSSTDSGLMTGLGVAEFVNEASEGDADNHSIQRGSWFVAPITPRAVNMPLPVEFTYFNGRTTNKNTVELTWETAQEIHSDYFLVQKSIDGRNFETIDEIAGQGVKYDATTYVFTDKNAKDGANYYRLKQVDWDGTFDMTEIVVVQVGKENGISILQNPVENELVINSQKELAANSIATVVSQNGSTVLRETFTAKSFTQTMNVNNLPAGVYVLRVVNGNEVYTERFVKK